MLAGLSTSSTYDRVCGACLERLQEAVFETSVYARAAGSCDECEISRERSPPVPSVDGETPGASMVSHRLIGRGVICRACYPMMSRRIINTCAE